LQTNKRRTNALNWGLKSISELHLIQIAPKSGSNKKQIACLRDVFYVTYLCAEKTDEVNYELYV